MHANILNANFYICLLSAQISLNLAISVASLIKKINKVFVKWEFFFELDVGKWQDDGWIAFCATGFPALLCIEQLIKGWKGKSKRGQGESRNRFWVSIMVRVCLTVKVRQPREFNLKADGGVAHIWPFGTWTSHRGECTRNIQVLMNTSPGSGDAGAQRQGKQVRGGGGAFKYHNCYCKSSK